MASPRPAINVVERNPYAPRPFVFSEVAICLRDAIRAAGYPSEHLLNRADPQAFSIVVGMLPDNAHEIENLDPSRCAVYNFEQLGSDSFIANEAYRRWLGGWMVIDYHSRNVDILLRDQGWGNGVFELPLVPSAALRSTGAETRDVDVLFYGSPNERRARVIERLRSMGLAVEQVSGAYGWELASAVRRAKLVLHVHFYETALFPVARMLQPVMMGVPIVCENSSFSDLSDWSLSGIVFTDYDHLAETCRDMLDAPERLAARARMTRQFVAQLDFETPFAAIVKAFEARARGEQAPRPPGHEHRLSDHEIARILEEEGAGLPPEHGAAVQPTRMVEREPGKGPYGKWIVTLLIVFSIYTIWMSMR